MAIYELEERIFFDGAMPADTNEVVDNSSSQEPENSNPEESATAVEPQSDSSTDVSISPETSSDSGDSSDSDSSSDSSDSGDSSDSSDSSDSDVADSSDSIDDLAASLADVQVAPNVIIVSTEDPDYQEIVDSADSDALIVEYDSSDDFDSILQKLKDELGDVSAANIGIVESDKLDMESADAAGFLDELSSLQISCGEINIIDVDGDGLAISDLEKSDDGSWHQVADSTNDYADYFATDFTAATAEQTTDLYFIDYQVDDIDQILAEIPDGAIIIELGQGEGIDKITEIINQYDDIDSVHIFSQANYAQIIIGKDVITASNISEYQEAFSSWSDNLSDNADVLFYGCDIARENIGQSVINQIAAWTGADVAASTDLTGNEGGDWDLEYSTGTIEAAVVSVSGYNHHLDIYDVTEITDDCSGTTIGTLSWAITESNNTPLVTDTIDFGLNSGTTVTLTGTLPTITDGVTIDGNDILSSTNVTVQVLVPGTTTTRVFNIAINDGDTVTIENMTIKGGDISGNGAADSGKGGAIFLQSGASTETLQLQNLVISGSKAYEGGGIYVYNDATLIMTNCTVSSCIATNNGGGIYSYANAIITRCTISNNTAGYTGGGMVVSYRSLTMFSSTVSNNTSSQYYGGIYFFASTSRIVSSTITGNSASASGLSGGIRMNGSTLYMANSIVAYNYIGSNYSDISSEGACTIYGNYNILGYDLTSTGSGNVYYTYSAGMGSTLFSSYTTISAGSIYQPVLANNGGDTYTVALAVSGSIASKTGCMIGTYLDGSTTKYAFSIDGFVTWKTIEDASTVVGVTPVSTDQRGMPRTGPDIGAYAVSYYYYRTAAAASGNWSVAGNWERSLDNVNWVPAAAAPSATNSTGIQIRSDASITVDSSFSITLVILSSGGTLSIASGQTLTLTNATGTDLTANGDISVAGTLVINSGASVDSGGGFTSTGTISFNDASSSSDNGTLSIASASPTLGTLIAGYGTITYDGVAQSVVSATYYNLTLAGSGTKTAAGNITVGNTLTVNSGVTFAAGTRTITVSGTSDINGTLTISTGTFDANGAFDATGGAVTFTGAGNLNLGSTVTSLGTFTCSTSNVTYDGAAQSVASATYYDLTLGGSGTKTAAGNITVGDNLTVNSGVTFAAGTNTIAVTGTSDIKWNSHRFDRNI